MAKVAANPNILKKRLQRFLQLHHNPGRAQVNAICQRLLLLGPVYLFGGAVRDIALQGIRDFYGDLDFVVDCPPQKLASVIQQLSTEFKVKQNKFGGYRLFCDKWWLDIWPLEDTWAFKANKIEFDSVSSLLQTTILNWDAAIYDLAQHQLIVSSDYFKQMQSGVLDLQLAENPNPMGAISRILRCILSKPVIYITADLQQFLYNSLKQLDFAKLQAYEQSHNPQIYLNQITQEKLLNWLTSPTELHPGKQDLLYNSLSKTNLELTL
ncbi:hypothetical protein [Catenovulum sediminis]|uniref:Poly A polymerase head domain-containing protein n=1 Tax=Catenovulum sediminis TaxID=1740262 RepID=A0ABV1RC76_9ALTE|nr:hypothetical protein [Catenovulum sediminis]